jgi:hypothetical protein
MQCSAGRALSVNKAGQGKSFAGILFQFFLVADSQFVAALCTAAGQHFSAISSLHTLAETVNGFAAASMRLKCPFHFN